MSKINIHQIREQFPILKCTVYGKPLAYFDNAATTHKPDRVVRKIKEVYESMNSNIHRGVHYLSNQATMAYEQARNKVQIFINAAHSHEVIFTSGATGAINLLANSFADTYLSEGDEIIISHMEHHSNIVPWQMVCKRKKALLKVIPINSHGELLLDEFEKLLSTKTKLVAVTYVSNTLGTVNPIEEIIEKTHANNSLMMVDASQAVQHLKVDVKTMDTDFLVFSGHKIYGPTGTGVLYGKEKLLNEMEPWQGGGEMIKNVSFEQTTYNELPFKFEAGTPNIAGSIALGEAIDFVSELGIENIAEYEDELLNYATEQFLQIPGMRIFGTASKKASVISFLVNDIHPFDMGTLLDKMGLAVRTGHHCTQPIIDYFGIPGTLRASIAVYNTKEEIDRLVAGITKVAQMFG
ncbi:aminotransferase class V-fold PLP-dependent enzyme [Saccharicrinis fermentans]|uniref:Cysteine desulfurase n=1 Tax=Saccharicrinis fermentans DSM 9555 = JCM 21142 TaxID=869213 RepID=W7Y625_9BACT|nr:cysteine desulfurase [Saccharicrinis fermentans]GAF03592.1 cysteine desulfurase [Saccharicrinis fermentans DSM 9555 = JCM 21142]